MTEKPTKFLQKKVDFNGKKLTLFSIDGATWSSRKTELEDIADRHEEERLIYGGQIKSGPQAKKKIQEEASAARERKALAKKNAEKLAASNDKSKQEEASPNKLKDRKTSKAKPKAKDNSKKKSVA